MPSFAAAFSSATTVDWRTVGSAFAQARIVRSEIIVSARNFAI
jgi:hypothetical protein